jgi:RNase P subunit RPR2
MRRHAPLRGPSKVSYRSRERKRQAKAAVAKVKREHSATMRVRYYLTKVKRDCRCKSCGGILRTGSDFVYRHDGQVTLCVSCADKDPLVDYRVSMRWETEAKRKMDSRRG